MLPPRTAKVEGHTENECYSQAEEIVATRRKARVHQSFFEQSGVLAGTIALALLH